MRFCLEHWDTLRAAIRDRGLDSWVSESGAELVGRIKREIAGEESLDSFDPLMWAHMAIVAKSVELAGGMALTIEGCPLCWLNLEHERACTGCDLDKSRGFDHWIDKAADAARKRFELLGGSSS